ncbi:MAG TPA: DUF2291 domain-containing protein [Actinomycetales bacterium]|nr:DUF2291 domain-containing protein [Actinomycetales bacterium]
MSETRPFWRRKVVVTPAIWIVVITAMLLGTKFYAPGTEPADTGVVTNENIVADPAAYAEEHYSTTVVPTIEDNAVDLATLLQMIEENPDAAAAEHGFQNGESPFSYPVRFTGTVTERVFGKILVEVPDVESGITVGVQTGPALTGTAIRDAVGLITFEMFRNQIDFASVATALNEQTKVNVLESLDFDSLVGSEVTVTGAFTDSSPTDVTVTAISIVEN